MTVIRDTKDSGVTLGVLGSTLANADDLVSVTFTDHNGTPHTVYAHRDGPFQTADEIVRAHETGELHPYESDEARDEASGQSKGGGN